MRLPAEMRASPDTIASVMFDAPTGQRIPLSQLAQVSIDRGPNTVSRDNVQRKIVVQANVADRDLGSTVADIREAVPSRVTLPAGYFIEYGGQFEAQEESTRMLSMLSLVAIAAIFLILYMEFHSPRTALLVMANLPLAIVGGILAVLLTGRVVSIATSHEPALVAAPITPDLSRATT